jgi:hypothetical protein
MTSKQKQKVKKEPWLHRYRYWVVFAFAFFLYANTITNHYCMDDELVTTTDKNIPHRLTSKGVAAIPQIFKEPYYKDNQGYAYDYRPVLLTTFAIEHSLFGDNPHVSHFINVILYALLCVLLVHVLSELLKDYNPVIPFVATLLFAAHPVHTEVVASIKNRDESLALIFFLVAAAALFRSALAVGKAKWAWFALSQIFLLSILSKPTAMYCCPS